MAVRHRIKITSRLSSCSPNVKTPSNVSATIHDGDAQYKCGSTEQWVII